MKYKAIEKLNKEFKEYKGDGFANVILEDTVNTIKSFCENEKFAEAVFNQPKTIISLCEEIVAPLEKEMNNTKTRSWGKGFSDIAVYKKAAEFYIPGADVDFTMKIVLPAEKKDSNKIIKLNLESFI